MPIMTLSFIPEALQILLAAMTPIGELRLAIPLGILSYGMPWYQVFFLSLAGNMLPVPFILLGLNRGTQVLKKLPIPAHRLLEWRTHHLRRTYTSHFEKFGSVFLVILVAIPLPFTGAWTGALVAWIFQLPPRLAIPLIWLGVIVAGVIVTALTLAGIQVSLFIKET